MPWFAAQVRSNCERRALLGLAGAAGPESFLPIYRVRSRRAGPVRLVERPLFPGYLFVRLAEAAYEERVPVLRAPGVVRLVSFAGHPAAIADRTIDSLRIITAGPVEAQPHPLLREGRTVRVLHGAFAGAVGRLSRGRGRRPRLVVTIEILGRAAAVPVDLADLVPVEDAD